MKCGADENVKDCCLPKKCCNDCNYEDCHEGCQEWEKTDDCECCIWSIKTVIDEVKLFDINKLAIYLHSFQSQDYSIEDIKNILSTDVKDFN